MKWVKRCPNCNGKQTERVCDGYDDWYWVCNECGEEFNGYAEEY